MAIKSLLLIRTSAIGDVLQTFPVLHYLRTRFPKARIDWVVEQGIAPLLEAHPLLSHVISIDSKKWRNTLLTKNTLQEFQEFRDQLRARPYDLVFDLQANTKSAVITGLTQAEQKVGFDWQSVREKGNLLVPMRRIAVDPHVSARVKYLQLVQRFLELPEEECSSQVALTLTETEQGRVAEVMAKTRGNHTVWMVCFGSKWRNKQLPTATWVHFLTKISEACPSFFLFVFSGDLEQQAAQEMSAQFPNSLPLGEMSLSCWQAFMQESDGIVTVDSAALHLAATTDTPSFSFFGPSLAAVYQPPGAHHAAYQARCPYDQQFSVRCPKLRTCATGACLRQLDPELLFEAFQRWARNKVSSTSKSM